MNKLKLGLDLPVMILLLGLLLFPRKSGQSDLIQKKSDSLVTDSQSLLKQQTIQQKVSRISKKKIIPQNPQEPIVETEDSEVVEDVQSQQESKTVQHQEEKHEKILQSSKNNYSLGVQYKIPMKLAVPNWDYKQLEVTFGKRIFSDVFVNIGYQFNNTVSIGFTITF